MQLVRVVNRRIPYNLSQIEKGRLGGRRPFSIDLAVNSPDELPTELPDSHGTGAGDVSEVGTGDIAAWIVELRVVEDVEEFSANLERLGFGDPELFLHTKIGVVDAWTMEEPPIGGAKRSTVRARCECGRIERAGGLGKSGCVKVSGTARPAGVHGVNRPYQIGHIDALGARKRTISHRLAHLNRETCRESSNTLQLPALCEPLEPAVEKSVKRKGPDVADYEILVNIRRR